jgi:hypothetical protein
VSSLEGRKERESANSKPEDVDLGAHAIRGKEAKGLEKGSTKTMPRCHNQTGGARNNSKGFEAVAGKPMEDDETVGPAEAVVVTLTGVTA